MSDSPLLPLDQVDPIKAWEPWEPSAPDPWNLKWAGHLYRRAAFGGTLIELREAVKQGHAATLDRLLTGDPTVNAGWEKLIADLGEKSSLQNEAQQLRIWWLYAILNTPHPLQEKLTLFWHNHFATSIAKVQRPLLMCRQNQILRKYALGKFRPFLLDMTHDAALLYWLDSNSNVKGRPNENYARELMELFSLGVGNYSETDIREAARAFTGWGVNGDVHEFDDTLHDAGAKSVFGQKGDWKGNDIVRIVLEQPVAARFIVKKLYRHFISETAAPPDSLVEPLAEQFRKSEYDIAALMRTILGSKHFYSGYAYRQRIKDPVEFAVGTVRALWDVKPNESRVAVEPGMIVGVLENLGQELFAPPNVKGWPGGQSWLNTATVLARHNYTLNVAAGHLDGTVQDRFAAFVQPPVGADPQMVTPQTAALMAAAISGPVTAATLVGAILPPPPRIQDSPPPEEHRDAAALIRREKIEDMDQVVDTLVDALLQGDITKNARAGIASYFTDGKPVNESLNRRIRETAHAIMTMPEYQLA